MKASSRNRISRFTRINSKPSLKRDKLVGAALSKRIDLTGTNSSAVRGAHLITNFHDQGPTRTATIKSNRTVKELKLIADTTLKRATGAVALFFVVRQRCF